MISLLWPFMCIPLSIWLVPLCCMVSLVRVVVFFFRRMTVLLLLPSIMEVVGEVPCNVMGFWIIRCSW